MSNAIRWGLVTFMTGVTCGTLGHYQSDMGAFMSVLVVSMLCAILGAAGIDMGKE
jgi:hypothetical protein